MTDGPAPAAAPAATPAPAAPITVAVFDKGDPTPPAASTPEAGKPAPAVDATAPAADATPAEAKAWWQEIGNGKFKDEGEAKKGIGELYGMATKNAKALKEAEDRWKGVENWFGAPMAEDGKTPGEYAINLPEGVTLDPVAKQGWEKYCRDNNLSNAKAQEVFDSVVLPIEAGRELGQREYERDRTIAALGAGDEAVATAASNAAFAWAAQGLASLGEDAIEDLRECGGVGAAINTIARLHAKFAGISMGRGDGGSATITEAEYNKIMADPRGLADPVNAAKATAFAEAAVARGRG